MGAVQVQDGEEIMLITDQGTLVRTRVDEVSSQSRNTQGVTLIRLTKGEQLVGIERVQEPSGDGEEEIDASVAEAEVAKAENNNSTEPTENQE